MALVTKNKQDLHEKAMSEYAAATADELRALLEYVMMMADIELPTDGGEEDEKEDE